MAKQFLVSTNGANVTLTDLGARTLVDPTSNLNLALEYTVEELRDSADLRAALEAGTLTGTFDGVAVNSGALFDEYLVDFDHVQVKSNTDAIAALTGSKTWAYSFTEDKKIKADRYLKTGNGVFSNLSSYIVPIACNIYGISVKSQNGISISYNVIIEDDGATAHTEAIVTSDSSFDGALSVAVAAGSEIAAKVDHTGDDIDNITVTVYFEAV